MTHYDLSGNVYSFEELLINNKDLCTVEYDEDQDMQSNIQEVKKKVKKNFNLFYYLFHSLGNKILHLK